MDSITETLKDVARSILDIGAFTGIAAKSNDGKFDAGIVTVHRFNFIGDRVVRGQVQEIVGIGPRETVEIVTEETRRLSREDEYETSMEVSRERETEVKDMTEVSDVLATTLTQTSRTSTSINVSANCPSVTAGGSQDNEDLTVQSKASTHTAKTIREVAVKASDRMKRSTRLRVKSVQELTEVSSSRRTLQNNTDEALNIAVRSALRMETVVVQRIDVQLCLKLTIENPGMYLLRGEIPRLAEDMFDWSSKPIGVTGIVKVPGPYPWQVRYGFEAQETEVNLPSGSEFDTSRADEVHIRRFDLQAMGPLTGGVANEISWPNFDSIFRVYVTHHEGTKARISISMAPDQTNLKPTEFIQGMSGKFEVMIPVRNLKSTMEKRLDDQKKALTENLRVAKRSQKDLREEERAVVLARVAAQWRESGGSPELPGERTMLDLERAWYELPPLLADLPLDPPAAQTYKIGGEESPAAPFGAGLGINDGRVWDIDEQRLGFLRAPSLTAFVPVSPEFEATVVSMLGLTAEVQRMVAYLANRRKRLISARDRNHDRLDPGDVPRNAKTWSEARWLEHEKAFLGDAHPGAPDDPEDYFPVVDRFRISTPVRGFFYEKIDTEIAGSA